MRGVGSVCVVIGPDGRAVPSVRSGDEGHCVAMARSLSAEAGGTYSVRRAAVFNGLWKLDDTLVASFEGGRRTDSDGVLPDA